MGGPFVFTGMGDVVCVFAGDKHPLGKLLGGDVNVDLRMGNDGIHKPNLGNRLYGTIASVDGGVPVFRRARSPPFLAPFHGPPRQWGSGRVRVGWNCWKRLGASGGGGFAGRVLVGVGKNAQILSGLITEPVNK